MDVGFEFAGFVGAEAGEDCLAVVFDGDAVRVAIETVEAFAADLLWVGGGEEADDVGGEGFGGVLTL